MARPTNFMLALRAYVRRKVHEGLAEALKLDEPRRLPPRREEREPKGKGRIRA